MMRVAVIDDEPLAREGVLARLAGRPGIEVVAEYADGVAALDGLPRSRPDLVLIDVEMPGLNGLEVLSSLPPAERPMAILLTAYDQFALQAFTLDVIDYLLKPIDDDRFDEALERAERARLYRRPAGDSAAAANYVQTFSVRSGTRQVFVRAADVNWIEADGDYAVLHAGGKRHMVREPLQRLAARLDPAEFIRVHRSAIVRISQLSEMQRLSNQDALLRLHDGTPLRVSRTYIRQLLTILSEK
ncbi:LytR/AlgR family response regulator transcription factor [Massilia endophytica]|uniref:LytR/AlgR family response regulator transcription factor n=1 Tax=Massilia endophytica TaxID=2899220 RepID=UPI001E492CF6|nr:LytTR family DNA-binding domain-containing protein [Massilia endophytica]UGQ48243.1 LytTR family DNA-binding domain-containing protein [Massilia endophytica]